MSDVEPTLCQMLGGQFSNPPVVTSDLSGKTVLVLGASRGLGYEAAKHFASMGPNRLILACRNQELGEKAVASIKADTGYGEAEVRLVDLQNLSSVKAFAESFRRDGGRLDILLANAATKPVIQGRLTDDGWESAFQTNNLSPHLLCMLLLPRLIDTAERYNTVPRLVVVSSALHYSGNPKREYITAKNPTLAIGKDIPQNFREGAARYIDTKTLNIIFALDLAARLSKHNVIVNAVDPGYSVSNLRSSFTGLRKLFHLFSEALIARSTEQGGRQLVWAALAGNGKESMHGRYVASNGTYLPSKFVRSREEDDVRFRERLWDTFMDEMIAIEPLVEVIKDKYLD